MKHQDVKQPYGLVPEAFDPSEVDSSTLEANRALRQFFDTAPPFSSMSAKQHRAIERAGGSPFATCSDSPDAESFYIEGTGGKIAMRVFRPLHSHGVYLHFHGGVGCLGAQTCKTRNFANWPVPRISRLYL